jgi:hypothetical protein
MFVACVELTLAGASRRRSGAVTLEVAWPRTYINCRLAALKARTSSDSTPFADGLARTIRAIPQTTSNQCRDDPAGKGQRR